MVTQYGTTATEQAILDQNDASGDNDTHLNTIAVGVYAWMNGELRPHVAVPLAGTEDDYDVIPRAEDLIVAGTFLMEREDLVDGETPTKGKNLKEEGERLLKDWITQHYTGGKARDNFAYKMTSKDSWES